MTFSSPNNNVFYGDDEDKDSEGTVLNDGIGGEVTLRMIINDQTNEKEMMTIAVVIPTEDDDDEEDVGEEDVDNEEKKMKMKMKMK